MQTNQLDEPSQNQSKPGSKANPIFINDEQEFENLIKTGWWCKFYCTNCGNLVIHNKKIKRRHLLCSSCQTKQTNLQRYGCENTFQFKDFKEKSKKTCLERYGQDCFVKTELFIEKSKKTNLERYGVEWSSKTDACKQKVIKTNNEKYGVDYATQLETTQAKKIATNNEKYGVDFATMSDVVKQKTRNTFIEKYGVDNPSKNECIKEKIRNICIERYGVDNASKSPEIKKKIKDIIISRYGKYVNVKPASFKYMNETFDSYWELCFYVYYTDNNAKIIREPEPIKYLFNDEEHLYYPDFKIDDNLYEIKGDQFFKKDGTMQNPYDHSQDALFEAKHQCAIQNNVIFIKQNEIKPYIKYVESKYGKNFKEEHKV